MAKGSSTVGLTNDPTLAAEQEDERRAGNAVMVATPQRAAHIVRCCVRGYDESRPRYPDVLLLYYPTN